MTAKILSIPRRPPPRRLVVRLISDRARIPHGRTRPFRFTEEELYELIEIAERIEKRGGGE
jgi:hypothetical protein